MTEVYGWVPVVLNISNRKNLEDENVYQEDEVHQMEEEQ